MFACVFIIQCVIQTRKNDRSHRTDMQKFCFKLNSVQIINQELFYLNRVNDTVTCSEWQ